MIQVLFALLLCTFFGLASLLVDLGFARHTQRQMTTATDAAALEGLRLEDSADEETRRAASRDLLVAHYDDDFGVTTADARNQGAGPLVRLVGGTTSMGANAQVVVDPQRTVYDPSPQLNLENEAYGDMVSGRYDGADLDHVEAASYARSDFDPNGLGGTEAFLVRLRRTDAHGAVDDTPGVSSAGPALPFLFGRGSLIDADARQRGLTVRATAIAGARRATLVGPADAAHGLDGAAPFLLDLQFWNALGAGQTTTFLFGGDGTLPGTSGQPTHPGGPPLPNPNRPADGPPGGPPIIPPGQMTGGTGEPRGVFANRSGEERASWSLGDPVVPVFDLEARQALGWLGNPEADGFGGRTVYVPIYDGVIDWDGRPGNSNPPFLDPVENRPKGEGPARVVGFGAMQVLDAEVLGRDAAGHEVARLVVRKLPQMVAPLNVSAVSTPGLAATYVTAILERHREVDNPLRAAALVR